MKMNNIDEELQKLLASHKTVIKVFGTGGAGNNTVSRLNQVGLDGVETFAINTDAQDLLFAQAHNKVLIGRSITNGLGAGSDPSIGEESALENEEDIRKIVADTDLVFVTCGLGGGTGTGSAPILAKLAREAGALTISIVTLPFSEEGVLRWNNARSGLEKLQNNSDTLIVIQNDKLWEIAPEIPLDDAFKVADEILVNAVKGITELVTQKGLVNLDFADIRTIMKDGGTALIGMAESDSPDRSREAVEKAIENPLIDLDIRGARNALLNITGGRDMNIKDAKISMQTLAQKLDKSAKIIWGARINPEFENRIRVMVIATGLKDQARDKLFRDLDRASTIGFSLPTKDEKREENEPETASDFPPTEEEPRGEESVDSGEKSEAKKIFREIMQEEADADLKTFKDTLAALENKLDDADLWQELRDTCSSLMGTAHMFDFFDVAGLCGDIEELIEQITAKQFFVKELVPVLSEFSDRIRHTIDGDENALEWARLYSKKLKQTSSFLKERTIVSQEAFVEELKKVWNLPAEGLNSEFKEEPVSASPDSDSATSKPHVSGVNEVVKFVDHLLRGEGNQKK